MIGNASPRLVVVALFWLSGCATGERVTAQGETEHQIVCGYALPWSLCEQRAARLCPAGYDLQSKEWNAVSGSEMWVRCR